METTIKVKTTAAIMDRVFNAPELVYIKYSTTANKKEITDGQINNLNWFNVTIRHNENDDAKKLFNKAAEKLSK